MCGRVQGGPRAMFRGVGPRALSNGVNSAVFFMFFEVWLAPTLLAVGVNGRKLALFAWLVG